MTKQEFLDLCHREFTRRGFKKSKKMYYLKGDGLLCGLYIQKSSYGGNYCYVEYDFFIGDFPLVKNYPSIYESDYNKRFTIWTQEDGEYYWGGMYYYDRFTEKEICESFNRVFNEHVMPIIQGDYELFRREVRDCEHMLDEEKEILLHKIDLLQKK